MPFSGYKRFVLGKNERFFIPSGRAQNVPDGAKGQLGAVQGRERQNSEENGLEIICVRFYLFSVR